jgi:hypothetical protein
MEESTMAYRKEHADAFQGLIARFESEAGARATVDAIAAALTQEGERLYEDGAYIRSDHYIDAGQELRNCLDRRQRALEEARTALKEQEPTKDHNKTGSDLRPQVENLVSAEPDPKLEHEIRSTLADKDAEIERLRTEVKFTKAAHENSVADKIRLGEQLTHAETQRDHFRARNAELSAAAVAIEEAHKVVVSTGLSPGSFRRHMEEPLYKLFALRHDTSLDLYEGGAAVKEQDPTKNHAEELAAAQRSPRLEHEVRSTLDLKIDTDLLHQCEIHTAIATLKVETGLPYMSTIPGEFVAGIYRRSVTLSSGQLAVIDNGLAFALVPWAKELDQHLGRHVTGVASESGGIEWSSGRKRGIEI